jgi:hypothetical protein
VSNRNGGRWRAMEVYIKGLKSDNPTDTFKVVYTGKGFINGRPASIDIEVYQNGSLLTILPQHRNIPNP